MKLSLAEREVVYTMRWKQLPTERTVLPPMPWKRTGYVQHVPNPTKRRVKTSHWNAEDKSPPHIRVLRAKFCNHFIKTGVLDEGMQAQLRKYADDYRAATEHPERVPSEPEARRYVSERNRAGDDGGRTDLQIDGSTAARIADFLRS